MKMTLLTTILQFSQRLMVYALVQHISNKQSAEVEESPVQNPLENSKMRFETPVPGRRFSCLYFQYNPDLRFSASQRRRQSLFASGFLTIGAMLFVVPSADAQTEVATAAASKAGTAAVAVVKAGAATVAEAIVSTRPADSQPPASNPSSPSSSNNSNSEPKQTEPKDVQKGGEDKKSSDVIKRPAEPEIPPDPDELAATPNEAGMLRMNFQGQP